MRKVKKNHRRGGAWYDDVANAFTNAANNVANYAFNQLGIQLPQPGSGKKGRGRKKGRGLISI